MVHSNETPPPGPAAYLTPCLIFAATMATVLSQLGLSLGGFTIIALFIVFDFLIFRLTPKLLTGQALPATPKQSVHSNVGTPEEDVVDSEADKQQGREVETLPPTTPQILPSHGRVGRAPGSTCDATRAPKGLRLCMNGKTVFFNPEEPIEFENEFFKGKMLFLVKTEPPDPKWDSIFEGGSRMFEMQIQGELKVLPKGQVYMGAELDERPKQGLVAQTVSKVVMSFAKQMIKTLHYSFGERKLPSDPLELEMPHVTFPLHRAMDYFVATPKGETAPPLGSKLEEIEEERVARKTGKTDDIEWSLDVVYTMCFRTSMVNFQEWAVVNVPGQGSLDLNTFLCKQPVNVVVYDFTAPDATQHKARDKRYVFQCTMINDASGHVARPSAIRPDSVEELGPVTQRRDGVLGEEGGDESDGGILTGEGGACGRYALGATGFAEDVMYRDLFYEGAGSLVGFLEA